MFKVIIFDFDDTLVHLNLDWLAVRADCLAFAEKENIIIPVSEMESLVTLAAYISNTHSRKRVIDSIFEKYELKCISDRNYIVFPSMLLLLHKVKSNGFKLAIASNNNSSTLKAAALVLELRDFFDCLVGRDSVQKTKPSPDQITLILKKLDIDSSNAFFIGDSRFDMDAAKTAGVSFFRFDQKDDKAVRKIESVLKLKD